MDEIAACCSRLGIMVNGQMQCLGTVQHLKTKYAQGYTLAIKLKSNIPEESQNDLERLEKLIVTKFSPCTLKDKHKVRCKLTCHLLIEILSMTWRTNNDSHFHCPVWEFRPLCSITFRTQRSRGTFFFKSWKISKSNSQQLSRSIP
jgi:ABC-type dipeptide/oligopeptide/nickel transport system ATPase component